MQAMRKILARGTHWSVCGLWRGHSTLLRGDAMTEHTLATPLGGNVLGTASNSFVVAEWRDPGGPPAPPRYIAPLHLHRNDDEAWYVLEGLLGVRVGDRDIEARPGSAVLVPRGTPHTYWNAGAGTLRYLLVMTPNIYRL